jgi:hypothetical protein
MRDGMYTDVLNGPIVYFLVLHSCDSDLARLGLFALEQGQPPRAAALAQWDGVGVYYTHFRKLVDSSFWSSPLPESRKLAWLPEHRVVFGAHRDLPFTTRPVACRCVQGTSQIASFHCRNIGVGAHGVVCLRVKISQLPVSRVTGHL